MLVVQSWIGANPGLKFYPVLFSLCTSVGVQNYSSFLTKYFQVHKQPRVKLTGFWTTSPCIICCGCLVVLHILHRVPYECSLSRYGAPYNTEWRVIVDNLSSKAGWQVRYYSWFHKTLPKMLRTLNMFLNMIMNSQTLQWSLEPNSQHLRKGYVKLGVTSYTIKLFPWPKSMLTAVIPYPGTVSQT